MGKQKMDKYDCVTSNNCRSSKDITNEESRSRGVGVNVQQG